MAVYAVVGITNAEKIGPKLATVYPNDHYAVAPNVWFVSDPGLPRDVGAKLEIANGILGAFAMIVPTSGYFGWGPKGAWDWVSAKTVVP